MGKPASSAWYRGGLSARNPVDRVNAIRQLQQVPLSEAGLAIPPLVAALNDPVTAVRAAACNALVPLISEAVRARTATDVVRTATTALIGASSDPEPEVRIAAATALGIVSAKAGRPERSTSDPHSSRSAECSAIETRPSARRSSPRWN